MNKYRFLSACARFYGNLLGCGFLGEGLRVWGLFSLLIMLSGCASMMLPKLSSPNIEINLASQSLTSLKNIKEQAKVVFFNSSNSLLYTKGGSGLVNVYIDGKAAGQIDIKEYLIVDVIAGEHSVLLEHVDIFNYKSVHEVNISKGVNYAKVQVNFRGSSLILQKKPDVFEAKYNRAYY